MAADFLFTRGTEVLCALLKDACRNDLPCAVATVVQAESELFHYEVIPESTRDPSNTRDKSTHDQIYWLASCTKLITAIACMQLVEQKKLALDDRDQLESFCPELKGVKVLGSDGLMTEKRGMITLRMLLTYTAGFGYSFINKRLDNYDEFSGHAYDMLQPLVNHPGDKFEYGISMDWAGIAVERVTGTNLAEYMQKHIFEPSGIKKLSILPSKRMRDNLAGFWQRGKDGHLNPGLYPLSRPLALDQNLDVFHSGGAGVWGSIYEFSKILMVLLNNGTSVLTGKAVLQSKSVDMMFENQLPHDHDFARTSLPAVKPDLVYPAEELYPLCPRNEPQGWGLGFMISPGVTGRSKTTAHWSGLSNCFWWCDREKGVAGIVGTQVLPFADPKAVQLWADVEKATYANLERG